MKTGEICHFSTIFFEQKLTEETELIFRWKKCGTKALTPFGVGSVSCTPAQRVVNFSLRQDIWCIWWLKTSVESARLKELGLSYSNTNRTNRRTDPQAILETLKLYCQGYTYEEILHILHRKYKVNVTISAIM